MPAIPSLSNRSNFYKPTLSYSRCWPHLSCPRVSDDALIKLTQKVVMAAIALSVALFVVAFFKGAGFVYLCGLALIGGALGVSAHYIWKYRNAAKLESTVTRLEATEAGLRAENAALSATRVALDNQVQLLSTEVSTLSTENVKLQQTSQALGQHVTHLGQQINTMHSENVALAATRGQLEQSNATLAQEITRLQITNHQNQKEFQRNNAELKANISVLKTDLGATTKKLSESTTTLDTILKEHIVFNEVVKGELQVTLAHFKTTLDPILNDDKLKDRLERIKDSAAELEKLRIDYSAALDSLHKLKTEEAVTAAQHQSELGELVRIRGLLDQTRMEYTKEREELSRVKEEIKKELGESASRLKSVSTHIHAQVIGGKDACQQPQPERPTQPDGIPIK